MLGQAPSTKGLGLETGILVRDRDKVFDKSFYPFRVKFIIVIKVHHERYLGF
jgi:hypothetical protein